MTNDHHDPDALCPLCELPLADVAECGPVIAATLHVAHLLAGAGVAVGTRLHARCLEMEVEAWNQITGELVKLVDEIERSSGVSMGVSVQRAVERTDGEASE